MKTTKILGALTATVLALSFASSTKAAQLKNGYDSLSDSSPNPAAATHTFVFTHVTGAALKQINFNFCTAPSGVADACTHPTNLTTTAAAKGAISGLTTAQWSVTNGTNGLLVLFNDSGTETVSANTPMSIAFTSITNSAINDCQPGGDTSSDTCYVRITSYTDSGTTASDIGIVSYTVVANVTVSARVDPTFTFVVQAVPANTVHDQITTSVPSTFGTLPFSNLTAGTPKYAAHALFVTTNTQAGYSVTAKMSQQMTGVYSGNNIDPFTSAWGSPGAWSHPSGSSPSVDTAWLGANTSDSTISGWSSPNGLFGAIGGTAVTVKQKTTSDDGTTPTYVTYAIEANVFQPADTYSGTLVYNALPTY